MTTTSTSFLDRIRADAPRPLLSRSAEEALGLRHRQILDELEGMFLAEGFAAFTIGDLVARLQCSRRTLYEIAPSKHRLVLVVLDRFLHRVGRGAIERIAPDDPAIERIRSYIMGGIALHFTARLFDDLASVPDARRLLDRHFRFVMKVVETLVAEGIAAGELRPVDPAVAAATIAGASLYLTQPEVTDAIGLDDESTVAGMLDILLPGLLPR